MPTDRQFFTNANNSARSRHVDSAAHLLLAEWLHERGDKFNAMWHFLIACGKEPPRATLQVGGAELVVTDFLR